MARCLKLLDKARRAPNNFGFGDLEKLAVCAGFVFRRQSASHRIYRHPDAPSERLNLQPRGSKAKPYQVRQLLAFIDSHYPDGLAD
ncbi:MAG: type II toxin-antitoxin system HicA family toxin [Bacteroidota bacterium]